MEMERPLTSCCRMKMKEDETRERNDKTGSAIAIDLSASTAAVSHYHLRGGRRKRGRQMAAEEEKKGRGSQVSAIK